MISLYPVIESPGGWNYFYGIFLLLVLFSYGFCACHPTADVKIGFVIGWSIINTSYRKHFLCIFFGKLIICSRCVVSCPNKTASDMFACPCINEYMFMCISVLSIFWVYPYCQKWLSIYRWNIAWIHSWFIICSNGIKVLMVYTPYLSEISTPKITHIMKRFYCEACL